MTTLNAPTVLLVDADRDSRTIYSMILEHHRYRVLHACTGEEGFRLACEQQPGLVVTELFMVPFQGRSLVGRLKEDSRTAHIPVIALTALPAYLEAPVGGWDSYLAKPCMPTRVLEEVRRHLEPRISAV